MGSGEVRPDLDCVVADSEAENPLEGIDRHQMSQE